MVRQIGANAFGSHKWPESPTIPDTCMSIGTNAFAGITVPINVYPYSGGLQYVKASAIAYNVLSYSTMSLPAMLSEIDDEAFEETAFEAVILPETVTSIAARAFANSDVHVVVFPDKEISIAEDAFSGCEHIRLACNPDSPAAQWAVEHGIAVSDCIEAA